MTQQEESLVSGTIEVKARVSQSEYLRFKERFPQYGALQWFITSVMRAFNDRLAAEPTLEEIISDSIETSVRINKLIADATRSIGKEPSEP